MDLECTKENTRGHSLSFGAGIVSNRVEMPLANLIKFASIKECRLRHRCTSSAVSGSSNLHTIL